VSHTGVRFPGLAIAALALSLANPGIATTQEVQAVPGPSNLKAEALSPSRIDLSWVKVTTSLVVEYRLYYANGTLIARLPPWQTRYSDTDLKPWTEYRYYITGVSFAGNESGPSNIATARTLDGTPPTKPGGFAGTATGPQQIALTWTAATDPESGIAEYVVYRGDSEIGRTARRTFADGSLQPDTRYEYRVAAVNGQGTEGPDAGPIEVRTPKDRPDAPRNLTATAAGPRAVDLDWTRPEDDDDVDGYRVYRDGSAVATTGDTDYRDTGLTPFTSYEYRVTALDDDGGESDPSNAAVVTTRDGSPPTTPTNLAAVAVGSNRIDLTWSASSDPESGISRYRVFRDGSQVGTATATSYQDDGLVAGTEYEYRVSAVNGDDLVGELSDPASARTPDDSAPSTPTELTAFAVSFDQVDLNWSASSDPESGIAYYRVFRDGSEVGTSGVTSFQDPGLTASTSYEYRVSAVNGEELESELSEPATAITLDEPGPPPPTDLVASPLSDTQIDLSWTAPSGDATGYNVYRDGAFIGSVTATTFVDTGLAPETTYRYAVASLKGEIQGERSSEVDATTLAEEDRVPPEPPSGLRLVSP